MNESMFSSKKHDYETPDEVFQQYNKTVMFNLDVCANKVNAKCEKYFTVVENGLAQEWWGKCWMNPPYGKEIPKWVKKAAEETKRGVTTYALLPARTDTRWFHDYIYKKFEVKFLKGRITFVGAPAPAPFPSMIVVFRGETEFAEGDTLLQDGKIPVKVTRKHPLVCEVENGGEKYTVMTNRLGLWKHQN